MPLRKVDRPDWNFLKFKHCKILHDGSLQEKHFPTERPWERDRIRSLLNKISTPETLFSAKQEKYKYLNDERLIELEAEANYLIKKQEKAIKDVERAYEENVSLIAECEDIDVDDVEYWKAVQFYQNYIKNLLYYFDLRAEEDKIIEGIEDKEEDTEEEEEEEEIETIETFSLGDDKLEEEEEEPPVAPNEEIKVDTTKQAKEEPIDKDLIYRDNEEELFDSDLNTDQTIASEKLKSEDLVILPSESDPEEQLQKLLNEDLKHEISFSDIARGFMKQAYEDELERIEEQKRLEEEQKKLEEEKKKLEMEKAKQKDRSKKRKLSKRKEAVEEFSEEGSEEQEEEQIVEESVDKETLPSFLDDESVRVSKGRRGSLYPQGGDETKTDEEIPFLTKPKYALLRRLTNTVKCKDLIQRIPDDEPSKKRKVKKVVVKKTKPKLKVQTPVEPIPEITEIPHIPEADKEFDEESLTAVRASEFKWGVPLLQYFALTGRKVSWYTQDLMKDDEEEPEKKKDEAKEVQEDGTTEEGAKVEGAKVEGAIEEGAKEEGAKEKGAKEEGAKEDEAKEEFKEGAAPEEDSELFSSGLTVGRTESIHSSELSKEDLISVEEEEKEKDKEEVLTEEEDDESVLRF
nr:golgin subfamily A member 6-like protein 22 isoform X2 [Halyomorpha halys]